MNINGDVKRSLQKLKRHLAPICLTITALSFFGIQLVRAGSAPPPLNISQVPLTVTTPIHPQVLIALGNSESMDGNLAGAIMTGSGSLGSNLANLLQSSSPATYNVPAGFTPPAQAAVAGIAPYTVPANGNLVDNGDSRLNVAKAGIQAIISNYMANTDFALETYNISNIGVYNTWVYHMSDANGFTFSSLASSNTVPNPCYGYLSGTTTVKNGCASIVSTLGYSSSGVSGSKYMTVGATSDDPSINDVLYIPTNQAVPAIFTDYNNTKNPNLPAAPTPANPYPDHIPPGFSLADYNQLKVSETYSAVVPGGARTTSPTNAGFVPFSPYVMYSQRGFGYSGNQSSSDGSTVVPMTTAGQTPTSATIAAAVAKFTPYLQPETNSANTNEVKSAGGQAPTAGLLAGAKSYLTSIQPSASNCPPKQYVVLISDGLPTQDLSGAAWPPLGSDSGNHYGLKAKFLADGSLDKSSANASNDTALTDTIAQLEALSAAGIQTYVIGLGAGVVPANNPLANATLKAMAMAGGTSNFIAATTPAALVTGLNKILVSIQANTLSTSAAAVNSTQLQSGSVSFQSNFTTSDKAFQDWTGDVFKYALDVNTGSPIIPLGKSVPTPIWSASAQLDTLAASGGWASNRVIASWNPSTSSGEPFEWASISAAQQSLLQPSDALGQARLEFLRGNKYFEKSQSTAGVNNGGTFRNRSHLLGDIVDSQPLYIGAPSGPNTSASYVAFETAKAARNPMIYVGANDGMLHAFDAATGNEKFAYVPNAVFSNLIGLTDPLYNTSHRFFVDGSPQSGDVQFPDNSWHTLVVGGENGGGKSIYALDVTNPLSVTSETALASAVLWEFSDAADLGLTYSEPQIAPINATPGYAVFFGNGYNSTNNSSVLYALNPKTGATIAKIDLCAAVAGSCNSTNNGLSTVSVGYSDGLISGPVSQIFGGDLQGNLWAIDVFDTDVTKWKVRLLFKAVNPGGGAQPITTAPVVTLHPNYPQLLGELVSFGTGQLLTAGDLSDNSQQSVYAIWDKPGSGVPTSRAALQSQTIKFDSVTNFVTDTANSIDWTTQNGWYIDLLGGGQRVVTAPIVINGTFIATLNSPVPPAGSRCGFTFGSMLLEVNYATGGAFDHAILDTNHDGSVNSLDSSNVVGIGLGTNSSSAPVFLTSQDGTNVFIQTTQSNGSNTTVTNPKASPVLINWWQLQ